MRIICHFVLCLMIVGCTSAPKGQQADQGVENTGVVIMTYNVENLFDTTHDEGKNDYEYRPRSVKDHPHHIAFCQTVKKDHWKKSCMEKNWDETLLKRKMQRLQDVIFKVNNGRGPDVLFMQEVENIAVLERFRTEYLSDGGYSKAVLIEGQDPRGIDTAMITRLPVVGKPKLHNIDFVADAKMTASERDRLDYGTRGILQAELQLPDGKVFTALVVHFPSQGSSTPFRKQAIKKLNSIKAGLPAGQMVVAGGDFNIARIEDIENKLYEQELAPNWLVSHHIGCGDCKGTNYYHTKLSWSFLDALLFDKSMAPGGDAAWQVEPSSIRIANDSIYQMSRYGSPARFGGGHSADGVSDHWPMIATLKPRKAVAEKE